MKKILLTAVFFIMFASSVIAAETKWECGLFGYKDEFRLCQDANELIHLYFRPAENAKNANLTVKVQFPAGVEYLEFLTDKVWLLPKWAQRTEPETKIDKPDAGLVVTFSLKNMTLKEKYPHGLSFAIKTTRSSGSGKVKVEIKNADNSAILSQQEYTVKFLPPIKGKRPKRLCSQIAYYTQFSQPIIQQTIASNIVNAGFTDWLNMNGLEFRGHEDAKIMNQAGLKVHTNLFDSVVFKDFPYDKYPECQEVDTSGKRRGKDVDMQQIIEKHPAVMAHLKKFLDHQFLDIGYKGYQLDEERSPISGFTKAGIKAFRKWAAVDDAVELNAAIIKDNYLDLWAQFRNRQVALSLRVIAEFIRKNYPGITVGYYGCPQIISKYKKWAKKHYVYDWRLLAGIIDFGGAGYDFPMKDMHQTVKCLAGTAKFYPWYMVIEHFGDWKRKYRKISAAIMQHMIATKMQGFAIWAHITCNNGGFYDIAQINTFLADYENYFVDGTENPNLLSVKPHFTDYRVTTYSLGEKHLSVITNLASKDVKYNLNISSLDVVPQSVTVRYEDGKKQQYKLNKPLTVPARSFVSIEFTGKIVRPPGLEGELYREDFERRKVGDVLAGLNGAVFTVAKVKDGQALKVTFDKPGKKILILREANQEFGLPLANYAVSAKIRVETDEKTFGTIGLQIRRKDKQAIFAGRVLDKGIVWAHYHDTAGKSQTYYIRHGNFNALFTIEIIAENEKITCKTGKTFTFDSNVINPGPPAIFIDAKAPGTVYIDNIVVKKLKSKTQTKNKKSKPQV